MTAKIYSKMNFQPYIFMTFAALVKGKYSSFLVLYYINRVFSFMEPDLALLYLLVFLN